MAASLLALGAGLASAASRPHRHCHRCRLPVGPLHQPGDDGFYGDLPYGGGGGSFAPSDGGDRGDIPFQWDDGRATPPGVAPYPQGFVLTVPVGPHQPGGTTATLYRYVEVATALGRCWSSDLAGGHWTDATLRVSFKRDGAINGVPRVVHVSDPADAGTEADVRRSLLAALTHCAPLPFSPSLGKAVAGEIFAIRFVQTRNS